MREGHRGLAGCAYGAGHCSRKVDVHETSLGKQIIFSGLVHDPDQPVTFGIVVGDHSIDFSKFQGCGETPILNAHYKAGIRGLVLHPSSGSRMVQSFERKCIGMKPTVSDKTN